MDKTMFAVCVPFEIGDIIQPQGFINTYKILDIVTINYAKTKKVDVVLQLEDLEFNTVSYHMYSDYKWNMVVCSK